jgi:hypothetical protein
MLIVFLHYRIFPCTSSPSPPPSPPASPNPHPVSPHIHIALTPSILSLRYPLLPPLNAHPTIYTWLPLPTAGFGLMVPNSIHPLLTACGIKDASATVDGSREVVSVLKCVLALLHGGVSFLAIPSGLSLIIDLSMPLSLSFTHSRNNASNMQSPAFS